MRLANTKGDNKRWSEEKRVAWSRNMAHILVVWQMRSAYSFLLCEVVRNLCVQEVRIVSLLSCGVFFPTGRVEGIAAVSP